MPAKKPKIRVTCASCGNTFDRHPYRINYAKNQFCNRECKANWMSKNITGKDHPRWVDGLVISCGRCGKEFRQESGKLKRNKRNFCSKVCRDKWFVENGIVAGSNNPMWKPPIVKPCDQCGKTIERKKSRVGKNKRTRHFCCKECKHQWHAENLSGENSPMWKGGKAVYKKYYGPNWRRQSKNARKRDGYACRNCGISQKKIRRKLDVHHIRPFKSFGYIRGENDNYKKANELVNLISLCPDCHKAAESGKIPVQTNLL